MSFQSTPRSNNQAPQTQGHPHGNAPAAQTDAPPANVDNEAEPSNGANLPHVADFEIGQASTSASASRSADPNDPECQVYVVKYKFAGSGDVKKGHWGLFLLRTGTLHKDGPIAHKKEHGKSKDSKAGFADGWLYHIIVDAGVNKHKLDIIPSPDKANSRFYSPTSSKLIGDWIPILDFKARPSEVRAWGTKVVELSKAKQYNLLTHNCHHFTMMVLREACLEEKMNQAAVDEFKKTHGSSSTSEWNDYVRDLIYEHRDADYEKTFSSYVGFFVARGYQAFGVFLGMIGSADRRTHFQSKNPQEAAEQPPADNNRAGHEHNLHHQGNP